MRVIEIRIAELEARASLERLFRSVKAREDNPAYVFVILQSDGLIRYYPFRIQPPGDKAAHVNGRWIRQGEQGDLGEKEPRSAHSTHAKCRSTRRPAQPADGRVERRRRCERSLISPISL